MSTINIKPKGIAYKSDQSSAYLYSITYNEVGVTYDDIRYTYNDTQVNLTSSIRPNISQAKTIQSKIEGINLQ